MPRNIRNDCLMKLERDAVRNQSEVETPFVSRAWIFDSVSELHQERSFALLLRVRISLKTKLRMNVEVTFRDVVQRFRNESRFVRFQVLPSSNASFRWKEIYPPPSNFLVSCFDTIQEGDRWLRAWKSKATRTKRYLTKRNNDGERTSRLYLLRTRFDLISRIECFDLDPITRSTSSSFGMELR